MKFSIFTLSIIISSFLLFTSCSEESNLTLDSQSAVVEGFLIAGKPIDSISITQSFSYARENTELLTLNDLEVSLKMEDASIPLQNIGNGIYQNLAFKPQTGLSYTLEFIHNGELVSAETYIPEKREVILSTSTVEMEKIEFTGGFPSGGFGALTQLDPIEITWDNPESDYYYVIIENIEENPEFVNDRLAEFEASGNNRRFFRITEPEVTDFHALNTRVDLTQFGTYRIIVFRVNPEYAALYESSGTSSLTITQPPSNVVNGLGIFTGVSSDTVYLEVIKI